MCAKDNWLDSLSLVIGLWRWGYSNIADAAHVEPKHEPENHERSHPAEREDRRPRWQPMRARKVATSGGAGRGFVGMGEVLVILHGDLQTGVDFRRDCLHVEAEVFSVK